MTLKSLNTVLHVQDYAGYLELFRDVFGFRVLRSWEADHSRGTILSARDGAELEIIAPPQGQQWEHYATGIQISLNVDDAAAYYRQLSEDDRITIIDPIGVRPYGVRSFGIEAPGGMKVYIVERLPHNEAYGS